MQTRSIREILTTRSLVAVPGNASLEVATELMLLEGVTAVAVLEEGNLLGVVSERDVLRHVSQSGGLTTSSVLDVMMREVICVETRDSIVAAYVRMMESGVRHLPVLDMARKVVGMLSIDDIPLECREMAPSFSRWRNSAAA